MKWSFVVGALAGLALVVGGVGLHFLPASPSFTAETKDRSAADNNEPALPDIAFEDFAERWEAPPTKADNARLFPSYIGQWRLLESDSVVWNDMHRPWSPSGSVRHARYELEDEKIDVYVDRLEEAPTQPYGRKLERSRPWREMSSWAKCGNQLEEGCPPDRIYHYAWIKGWFIEADSPLMHHEVMEPFFVEYLSRLGHTSPPAKKK
jgi:hypothetical protein